MFNVLKKLFGIKAAEKTAPVPYKVETPVATASTKKPAVKKVAAKKSSAKPRKPKTPKA